MVIKCISLLSAALLVLVIASVSAVTQKSMLTWPIVAPTRVAVDAPDYDATGWAVARPFGWQPSREQLGEWELHEGIDLIGSMFCTGCAVPPLGDVTITQVGWDQAWADDPLHDGDGVVVDMELQHPEEAGRVRIRYGHLQPYRLFVRTRSCTQTVDCPRYRSDSQGNLSVICPGPVVMTGRVGGERSYVYATPGVCTISVTWPIGYLPQGATTLTFDQRIIPGAASSDAAITFTAQIPPPPPPITPTAVLPPQP